MPYYSFSLFVSAVISALLGDLGSISLSMATDPCIVYTLPGLLSGEGPALELFVSDSLLDFIKLSLLPAPSTTGTAFVASFAHARRSVASIVTILNFCRRCTKVHLNTNSRLSFPPGNMRVMYESRFGASSWNVRCGSSQLARRGSSCQAHHLWQRVW